MSALATLRDAARARAAALPAPAAALEDWRYVRCDPLAAPAPCAASSAAIPLPAAPYLLLRDGIAQPGGTPWPDAWRLDLPTPAVVAQLTADLAAATDASACWTLAEAACVQHLRVTADAGRALTIVDAATGGIGAWHLQIDVADGAVLELHLIHHATGPARALPSLHLSLGVGARVVLHEIQRGVTDQLLARWSADLATDARLEATVRGRGGRLVRHQISVHLQGERAAFELAALLTADGDEQAHLHTRVMHAASRTTSNQLAKTIVDGRARTSFDGCVAMAAGISQGDAQQHNRNLVLSPTARADTRPQLDIRADDVKAAHGATVGRLDEDEMLYLRLRGLDAATASALLTTGYIAEVESRLPEALR